MNENVFNHIDRDVSVYDYDGGDYDHVINDFNQYQNDCENN